MNKRSLGKQGEDVAVSYLEKNGYRILWRNWRRPWGEIDIVAEDVTTKELVFVEVKSARQGTGFIDPEENLTPRKINKLRRVILSYLVQNPDRENWRLDVVTVTFASSDTGRVQVAHYKNIECLWE